MSKKDNNINNVDEADVNINDTDVTSDTDKDADTVEAQGSSDADVKAEKSDNASDAQGAEETVDINNKKDQKDAVIEDLQDRLKRQMAEFDNYRKRMMRERVDLIKNASERVVLDLLPIIDNFERSLKSMETSESVQPVVEGVNLIYQQMMTLLKQQGVSVIETENQLFNDEFHEAITTTPAPSEDMKGKIIDCVQKGYLMNDKVIRFPKVVVGQ